MNIVILSGKVVRENPDCRTTQKGTLVARFKLMVKNPIKNDDGTYNNDFFDIVAYGSNAEFIQKYVFKDTQLSLRGRLNNYSYKGQDGNTKYGTDIILEQLDLGYKENNKEENKNESKEVKDDVYSQFGADTKNEYEDALEISPDDLPF